MSDKRAMEAGAVSFSERLASSQVFATLFRDGMALVEETAAISTGRAARNPRNSNAAPIWFMRPRACG